MASVLTDGSTSMVDEKDYCTMHSLRRTTCKGQRLTMCQAPGETAYKIQYKNARNDERAVLQTINHMLDSKKNKFSTFVKDIAADIGDG